MSKYLFTHYTQKKVTDYFTKGREISNLQRCISKQEQTKKEEYAKKANQIEAVPNDFFEFLDEYTFEQVNYEDTLLSEEDEDDEEEENHKEHPTTTINEFNISREFLLAIYKFYEYCIFYFDNWSVSRSHFPLECSMSGFAGLYQGEFKMTNKVANLVPYNWYWNQSGPKKEFNVPLPYPFASMQNYNLCIKKYNARTISKKDPNTRGKRKREKSFTAKLWSIKILKDKVCIATFIWCEECYPLELVASSDISIPQRYMDFLERGHKLRKYPPYILWSQKTIYSVVSYFLQVDHHYDQFQFDMQELMLTTLLDRDTSGVMINFNYSQVLKYFDN